MKAFSSAAARKKLTSEINLARLRLTDVETKLVAAKELARLARQRRKAAKLAARQAKKRARLAKARVGRAEVVLAKLETRLAQLHRPLVRTKPRKTPAKKVAAAPLHKTPVQAKGIRPRRILKIKAPALRRTKTKSGASQSGIAGKISNPVAAELETPVVMLPSADHKPTPQIVKGVGEIFTGETEAATTEETGAQTNPTSEIEIAALPEPMATPSTINA